MRPAEPSQDFPVAPEEMDRWIRLMDRFKALHPDPEALLPLLQGAEFPTLQGLLGALGDDASALGEDLALQGWAAWDREDFDGARNFLEQAKSLLPEGDEVRVLDLVLGLEGEARLEALRQASQRLRAALSPEALQALHEGRGAENIEALRLHRCLSEEAHLLLHLDQKEAVVALVDEMFMESDEDTFGVFPALVQAALATDSLDVLDAWVDDMGADYPGLQEWLRVYLCQTADQPGAAFQALRRARKAFPQLELAILKWHEAVLRAESLDPDTFPQPVFPTEFQAAGAFMILAPAFIASPEFMAWLKRMRSLR